MFDVLGFLGKIGFDVPNSLAYSIAFISGQSSTAKSSPVKVGMWSPEQTSISSPLAEAIRAGIVSGVPTYPKALSVPRTAEEEAYFSQVPGIAESIATARAKLGQPAYQVTPETTEQYYQNTIKAPMMKDWQEIVEPMTREAFAGPGYWGSARAQAQVKGATDLATELGSKRAELYYADEQARRAAAEAAAGREATGTLPYAQGEAEVLGSAGQYARQIEQEKVLADFSRWLSGETVEGITPTQYNPYIQLAMSFLGLEPYALGTKGTSSSWGFGIMSG